MGRALIAAAAAVASTVVLGIPGLIIVWFLPGVVFRMSKLWARMILGAITGVRITVSGMENLVAGAQYIFLSNHQGALDIPALMCVLPGKTRFIAKKELGRIPIFGWAMMALGHIMIDRANLKRAKESIELAARRLRDEHLSVIAFPEGTRTRDGKVRPFKKGLFILAIQSGVPVVPVAIQGSFEVFPKGWFLRYRPGTIRLHIHPPIDPSPFTVDTRSQFVEKVRNIIVEDVESPPPE